MSATSHRIPHVERAAPDRVTLPARPGDARSEPAVEIYVGTEPAQLRATRTLLWSIEQVRDPGRVYHVHILSALRGFDRRGWRTGSSNYRFAVPHYAGRAGCAIYCDAGQIFLTDPGRLFDLELCGAGYLAISDSETSVMLIDCKRMAEVWSLDDARHASKKAILRRTLQHPGIRGDLDPHWNARDAEFVAGRSHLLHYSTLHTQPWRPFPERFVYRKNRDERLWLELEDAAIRAGFETFTANHPTRLFRELLTSQASTPNPVARGVPRAVREVASELVRELGVSSVLELVAGDEPEAELRVGPSGAKRGSRQGLLGFLGESGLGESGLGESGLGESAGPCLPVDAVVVAGGFESIPAEDVPWAVESLFQRSGCLLLASVPGVPLARPERGQPPSGTVRSRAWWIAHFEAASRRHPGVHWQLLLAEGGDPAADSVFSRSGGRLRHSGAPSVWVLLDDRPGNTTQSIGLAEELGWPYQRLELSFRLTVLLPNPVLGASAKVLRRECRRRLVPPWPDLVIAAGRRTAPVARWIRDQSRGRARVVQLGRKGANPAEHFDLAITPAHARLCAHPNRIETAGIPTRIRASELAEAAVQWDYLFAEHSRPRIAVLVGGASHDYSFSPKVAAALAWDVAEMAERAGGSCFVTTSRRTGVAATDAIARALPSTAHLHRWSPEQKPSENPLLGFLALADVLVVTGESESMLAEAIASGRGVHIYPLPRRRPGVLIRVGTSLLDMVVQLAEREPHRRRGTTRPQQGLELFCSRLLARGFIRPNRDLARVHATLVERGRAQMFDGTLGKLAPVGHSEIEDVANRVRVLMRATEL